jgi:hypothetical protein
VAEELWPGWLSGPVTYHLTIGSANGSVLALNKMPFISLMNEGGEIDNVPSGNVGPYYATPWQLNPGYHTEAEAGFLSRGFISSSAWRDLILDSDPVSEIETIVFFDLAQSCTGVRLRIGVSNWYVSY